jgi:hypothetical protein
VYGFVNSGQGCWKCTSIKFAIKLKFSSVQFSSAQPQRMMLRLQLEFEWSREQIYAAA